MTSSMYGLLSKAPYGVYAVDMSQTILDWHTIPHSYLKWRVRGFWLLTALLAWEREQRNAGPSATHFTQTGVPQSEQRGAVCLGRATTDIISHLQERYVYRR